MAEETTQVVIDLGLEEAEESLEVFMQGMESLQDLAKNIGAELRKAFTPLQAVLQKTAAGIGSVTGALTEVTATIETLMSQMASEQNADQWLGGISTTVDTLALGVDSIKLITENSDALSGAMSRLKDNLGGAFEKLQNSEVWSTLTGSIGGVTAKLKESALAWGEQTAKKIADKAEDVAILALYAVDYAKQFGMLIGQLAASTAAWIKNTAAKVASTTAEWAQIAATTVWNGICATATAVTSAFGAAMAVLTSPITLVVGAVAALIAIVVLLVKNWDTVKEVAVNTWNTIVSAFGKAGAWFQSTVLDPLVNGFKGTVNGVIGFINGLIAGVVKGINGIINMLNKLQFSVPDWIPGLGGKTFGFYLQPVSAPQIPYLAKGAVLPANRPFLAMVGDQRHGTNIEAPLATIQEAMAVTMEDFVASNMAGHEATIGVLRQILEAVLGIHIGDAEVGRAVQRYQQKMAVVHGRRY